MEAKFFRLQFFFGLIIENYYLITVIFEMYISIWIIEGVYIFGIYGNFWVGRQAFMKYFWKLLNIKTHDEERHIIVY